MFLHGARTDIEYQSNFPVCLTAADPCQNLALTVREPVGSASAPGRSRLLQQQTQLTVF